jgi:hypothetical protein
VRVQRAGEGRGQRPPARYPGTASFDRSATHVTVAATRAGRPTGTVKPEVFTRTRRLTQVRPWLSSVARAAAAARA